MKQLLIFSFSMLSTVMIYAQNRNDAASGKERRFSAGIHAGTQGVGVDAGYQLHRRWMAGLAVSYAPYGYTATRTLGKNAYDIKMKERLGNVQALIGWKPFAGEQAGRFLHQLYIIGGGAVFYKQEANATATPKNDYHYGDIIIKKEDLGTVKAAVQWKKIAPYGGFALRNLKLGGRVVFNADLGTFYLSKPVVDITADNLLSENTSQEVAVQKNLDDYRWLPVLQVGVGYKF
ncbi:hypothetical protein LL912_25210 [Niabella sp. CC-SYL272]|uniref:hypothetical protein n=1 Tax=Niabella agricola TaxID=2891571 RepID=UPI001F314CAF|nr:hypothetical protein [Niabella agricola]MCF3112111.1 hypothetical protein [Niabella agricola]